MFPLDNPNDLKRFEGRFASMILGSTYGVDTFFVLRYVRQHEA